MQVHHHPHPGELLHDELTDGLCLSISVAAARLGVSRVALSRVVNGRAAISADLAIRLERGGLSTARFWLSLQANYELWKALQRTQPEVQALQAA